MINSSLKCAALVVLFGLMPATLAAQSIVGRGIRAGRGHGSIRRAIRSEAAIGRADSLAWTDGFGRSADCDDAIELD